MSQSNPSAHPASTIQAPPRGVWNTLRKLGPGLIIAGSIVGSGELIATTKTGAQAGMALLWLIVVGCVIKVFVQIELGRYTLSENQTTLAALNRVPGPRLGMNWVLWMWLAMMVGATAQLGGIVGGVGQALAIAWPLQGDYRQAVQLPSARELKQFLEWERQLALQPDPPPPGSDAYRRWRRMQRGYQFLAHKLGNPAVKQQARQALEITRELEDVTREMVALAKRLPQPKQELERLIRRGVRLSSQLHQLLEPATWDDKYWAALVALVTVVLLFGGRYRVVQHTATVLVVLFTFLTIGNVVALQSHPEFRLTWADFLRGFGLPEGSSQMEALATALATFGIIGVGATELIAYPYWCLEKGYARFTGPKSDDPQWAERARGWMRVMHYDAFLSMLIYTVATLAFFLMGVAVLHRQGLDPEGMRMVSTLLEQYVPVFGEYAKWLFLAGAIAVLYSTFLVATAGSARVYADWLHIMGWISTGGRQLHRGWVSAFCVLLPVLAVGIYATLGQPARLVLLGGFMQALMLPVLGVAALYFRYRWIDPRLRPGRGWDVLLWLSVLGLAVAGLWGAWSKVQPYLGG